MYFQADNNWEMTSPMIRRLLGENTRHYGLIQLGFNFNMILLDVEVNGDDDIPNTERFMFGDIRAVLDFMKQDCLSSPRLSLMSRRCDNDGLYSVADITKVIMGYDSSEQPGYVYHVDGGREYLCSFVASSADELENKKIIYARESFQVAVHRGDGQRAGQSMSGARSYPSFMDTSKIGAVILHLEVCHDNSEGIQTLQSGV